MSESVLMCDGCVVCERVFTKKRPCCCAERTHPTFPGPGDKIWHLNGKCAECCDHNPAATFATFQAECRDE